MGNALGVYGNQVPEGHWESNVLGVYGNQVPLKHRGIERHERIVKGIRTGADRSYHRNRLLRGGGSRHTTDLSVRQEV